MPNKYMKLTCFYKELKLTLNIPKVIKEIKSVVNEPALWNNRPRKTKRKRVAENILWYLKNKEPCIYYNSYGFDIEGLRDKKEYLPYRRFRIERFYEDYPSSIYDSKLSILRDKVLFAAFMGNVLGEKYVIKTAALLYADGRVYDFSTNIFVDPLSYFKGSKAPLFVKKLKGECGDGCYLVSNDMDIQAFLNAVKGSSYIIQNRLDQHEQVNRINPSCINTIRMITIIGRKSHKPHLFAQYMRVGCKSINDNRATGGVGVGISDNGIMQKFGVGHHKVETQHSITNHIYEGTVIPYWNEAKELVIRAHEALPEIPTIGWDVAITPNGPVLIEGNDNWEISGAQDSAGGLKKKWYEYHDK